MYHSSGGQAPFGSFGDTDSMCQRETLSFFHLG